MSSEPGRAVVLYRRGPRWDVTQPLGAQEGVQEHIAYLASLHAERLVERAGPFHAIGEHVEHELVGLVVNVGGVGAARERALRDPAVRAGLLEFDALAWHA